MNNSHSQMFQFMFVFVLDSTCHKIHSSQISIGKFFLLIVFQIRPRIDKLLEDGGWKREKIMNKFFISLNELLSLSINCCLRTVKFVLVKTYLSVSVTLIDHY